MCKKYKQDLNSLIRKSMLNLNKLNSFWTCNQNWREKNSLNKMGSLEWDIQVQILCMTKQSSIMIWVSSCSSLYQHPISSLSLLTSLIMASWWMITPFHSISKLMVYIWLLLSFNQGNMIKVKISFQLTQWFLMTQLMSLRPHSKSYHLRDKTKPY